MQFADDKNDIVSPGLSVNEQEKVSVIPIMSKFTVTITFAEKQSLT